MKVMIDTDMKMEVPEQIREFGVKSVDQTEAAFASFMESATKSVGLVPAPMSGVAKQALQLTDKNLKASFDLARQLMHAKDINDVMRLHSDFLQSLYKTTSEQFRQMASGVNEAPVPPAS
jgi:hypothetical protein